MNNFNAFITPLEMKATVFLLILLIGLTTVSGGKKGKKDSCKKDSKALLKCLKKGYEPTKLSEGDLEDCKVKPKEMKKKAKKKCAKKEKKFFDGGCSPLCKKEDVPPPSCKKTVDDCKNSQQVFPGGAMEPKYYDDISTFDGCVEKCRSVAGCVAFVYIPKVSRCFTKNADHGALTPEFVEGRISFSMAMSCLDETAPCSCTKKTVEECKNSQQVFPGGAMEPKYYDDISTFDGCVEKCRSVAGCVAFVYIPKVSRCFTKNAEHGALTPEFVEGRISFSMAMSCLEECSD